MVSLMSGKKPEAPHFVVERNGERRKSADVAPPYLTSEGLVLVDRRDGDDRRAQQTEPVSSDNLCAPFHEAIEVCEIDAVEIDVFAA